MKKLTNISNAVKRNLKRKVKITESLLVIFLITGGVTFSGEIAGENYGVIIENGGVRVNFLSSWEVKNLEKNTITEYKSANNSIKNLGDYGMAGITNDSQSGKTKILNRGLIENGNNYGMYVESTGQNTKSIGINEGYKLFLKETIYILNESKLESSYDEIANELKELECLVDIRDGVKNLGDYGMAALSKKGGEAKQINKGLVENGKNYGMYAKAVESDGIETIAEIVNLGGESLIFYSDRINDYGVGSNTKNENGIKNQGDYGMSGLSNGKFTEVKVLNTFDLNYDKEACSLTSECEDPNKPNVDEFILSNGLVANSGEYGMIGTALEGGKALLINEGIGVNYGYDYIKNKCGWGGNVRIELNGGVKNQGDYGMVALTDGKSEAIAINRGLIANNGDYGMYSEGDGSLIENYGMGLYLEDFFLKLPKEENPDNTEFEKIYSNISLNIEGGIKNQGNYGMVVEKKGNLLNKGLIQNKKDYGIHISDSSIGENRGRDLSGRDILNIFAVINTKENKLVSTFLEMISDYEIVNNFLDSGDKNFEIWLLNSDIEDKEKILKKLKEINVSGGVRNEGNIGVYVEGNSYFINHGVINPEGITKTLEGKELLKTLGFAENEKIAIVGGTGNNTITLGTGSEISGKVSGGLGDNTLHFIDTYNEYTGEIIENNIYGDIVPRSFSHMIFGKNKILIDKNGDLVFEDEGTLSNSKWEIKEEIVLDYHKNTNKNDYTSVIKNGKLTVTTDKFNGIHINGKFLERDRDREIINKLLTGNVSFESGANLVKHVGKNVTSTLAANSINMNGGTITQRVLDNLFVTDANRIEITNIFTSGLTKAQKRAIEERGLLINGEQASGNISLPEEYFKVESIGKGSIAGWTSWHEYDPITGDVTLIFEREKIDPTDPVVPDKGNYGLQGGYAQSINKYTQSNVDILNTVYIKNQGYNYARRTAFIPKKHNIRKEQITYPSYISDKELSLGKENIYSPVVEIVEVENGERYNNLQMAEIFRDYGKYTGNSSSEFNYDTWGVTGGTFHRFNDQWLVGASYGYAKSKVDYKTGEGGKEDIDTIGINLFLTYEKNSWLSINTIGYSWNKHDLSRKIYDRDSEVLGKYPIQTMSADFNSHLISLGSELGYRYFFDEKSYLYPHIGLDYMWYTRESYKESGDSYALEIDENKLNTFVSKIGLLYEKTWEKIGVFGDVGWQHYFDNFKSFDGRFYNESPSKYRIDGLDIGKDAGYIRAGINYNFNHKISIGVDYTGTFRSNEFSNIFGLNIEYKW